MHFILWLLLLNAACGLAIFEWTWKRVERQRTICEERDSQWPGFRRVDVHLWKKWKFYPGACIWLIPRTILIMFTIFACFVTHHICYFCADWSKPLTGFRRWVWMKNYNWACRMALMCMGYRHELVEHSKQEVEKAYAKYLGKNWQTEEERILAEKRDHGYKRCSIIVSNHIGFIDELCILNQPDVKPSFTPAHFVKDLPVASTFIDGIQGIYIDRNAPLSQRDKLVD